MDVVRPDQILTLALFLGLLLLVWVFTRLRGKGVARTLRAGKRISVEEVTALSPTERGMIVCVDGTDYFVIQSKGCQPTLLPLPKQETVE